MTTMRRAQSTPYNLRTSLSRTEKARDLSSPTDPDGIRIPKVSTKRKRDSSHDGSDVTSDGTIDGSQKRMRREYDTGRITSPLPKRGLPSLPTPDRAKICHDFTAGGIPPEELISPDLRFLFPAYYKKPPVTEWAFDPELGMVVDHIKLLPLPEEDGSFAGVNYEEQIQGSSLLLKRYCGRPVSPVHQPEPQEMTYKEWEQFAKPIGLLLEAVEGTESVYDVVTGK